MSLPTSIKTESRRYKENNDCSVKAIAIATHTTYAIAHRALKSAGRKNNSYATPSMMQTALNALGFVFRAVKTYVGNTAKTIKLPSYYNFVAFGVGHTLAIVNGKVADHTSGSNYGIQRVYRVVPA
jgi:hypothetical protein